MQTYVMKNTFYMMLQQFALGSRINKNSMQNNGRRKEDHQDRRDYEVGKLQVHH